jgi:uncharacterized membrane protein YraQ (UPF0718 family)
MTRQRPLSFIFIIAVILLVSVALIVVPPLFGLTPALNLPDLLQTYVTRFLGIFIEAIPFLLLGAFASGVIAVFITPDDMARIIPHNKFVATVMGALLGMIFPVCECGVVPVVRRLYQKGLPAQAGIAFILGAPVLNPIVIASTYAAFGFSSVFWARIGFSFLVAMSIGLVFSVQPNLLKILRPASLAPIMGGSTDLIPAGAIHVDTTVRKLQRSIAIGADEFFDVGRYLVIGALIATTLQTLVPQQWLISIGTSPVTSVIALCLLAFVLSVCSTVDAFLALSFVNTFTNGSIITFLVFGPMVDIKSTLMFLGVFRRRVVLYLVLLPLFAAVLIGLVINLNLGW